jgi:hypothetical protein
MKTALGGAAGNRPEVEAEGARRDPYGPVDKVLANAFSGVALE